MEILNHTYGQLKIYRYYPSHSPGAEYAEINVNPGAIRFSDVDLSLNVLVNINGRQGPYNKTALDWLHRQWQFIMPGQYTVSRSVMFLSVSQWQAAKCFYFRMMPTLYRIEVPRPDVIGLGMAAAELSAWEFSELQEAAGRSWRHVQV